MKPHNSKLHYIKGDDDDDGGGDGGDGGDGHNKQSSTSSLSATTALQKRRLQIWIVNNMALVFMIVIALLLILVIVIYNREAIIPMVISLLTSTNKMLQEFLTWVRDQGYWGPIFLIPAWIFASAWPSGFTMLTLACGYIYGVYLGFLICWIESTIGGMLVFIVSRYFFRNTIEKLVHDLSPKLKNIYDCLDEDSGKMLFFIRLSPIMPFSIFNLLFSLSPITLPSFFLATVIGIIPRILVTVLTGAAIDELSKIFQGDSHSTSSSTYAIFLAIPATVVAVIVIAIVVKRAITRAVEKKKSYSSLNNSHTYNNNNNNNNNNHSNHNKINVV